MILGYFSNLYSTNHPSSFNACLSAVTARVTYEMNCELLRAFREEEIRLALNQMHPTKAPSPNDVSPIFFEKYWDVVGQSVLSYVNKILNIGVMPKGLNETYICLIPKVDCLQKVTEFKPISLCNVVYKIVFKVLANRLKKILPAVIDESQSAFVPGRQITNNVLVAIKTMHCIDQRRKGNKRLMTMKLGMSKAYDRVEWALMKAIMMRLGFHERWIMLIMMCVSTVSYSMLINGELKGNIILTRGFSQGDPISPYLFLLCAEGLTAMLQREEREGLISGILVC